MPGEGVRGKKRSILPIENTACAKGQRWEAEQYVLKNWTRR